MNPSEDPNDRLLDSLLRESRRGGADLPLLQNIADRIDVSPAPVSRRRLLIMPWLAAAACLAILGIGWALWHGGDAGGGATSPDPTVEKGRPSPKVVRGSDPPEKAPSSLPRRNPGGVVPVPVPSGDVAVAPTPEPGGGDSQVNPAGGGSQTLRDFAERRVAMGEGVRVRGLCFPADLALTEVFAHDPDAPEGTSATRIEVSANLATAGQFLKLKGDRVIISDLRERPENESGTHVFGSIEIPREATEGIFLILSGSGRSGGPTRRAVFLDVSLPGSIAVANLSPAEVRLQLEDEIQAFKAGERRTIQAPKADGNGLLKVGGFVDHQGAWRKILTSAWPHQGASRIVQIFWLNPASKMVELSGFRMGEAPNMASGDAHAGAPDKSGKADTLDGLKYLRDESTMWYVQFGLEASGKWAPRLTGRTPDKKILQNRVSAVEMLIPGDTFFKEGVFANRFWFTGLEERDVRSERTGLIQRVKFATYEDLKPNKKGEKYESQAGLPDAELTSKAYYDRIAILNYLGREIRVEEWTKFTLPGDPSGRDYFMYAVTPESVTIQIKDANGEVSIREIKKGAAE